MAIVLRAESHRMASAVRNQSSVDFDIEGYREFVFRCALSVCGEPEGAEDVAQEVLMILLKSRRQIEATDQPLAWIRKVTVRSATHYLKRQKRTVSLQDSQVANSSSVEGLAVLQTLQRLSPEHRVLLGMAMGQGLSYREIADALGIPEGTVASRLNAAKKAFQQEWER